MKSSKEALKFSFGRGMNASTDVYVLPSDPEEINRLTLQHHIWKLLHGDAGLYPRPVAEQVEEILAGKDGRQPVVLDVGTGSGIWVLEMAERFPNAHVVGLDIFCHVPEPRPSNCSSVKEDISKHIPQYVGQFDVIHARNVLGDLMNPKDVLESLASYLRPGGILLLLNGHSWKGENMEFLSPSKHSVAEPGRCWVARWSLEVRLSSPLGGTSPLVNENPDDFVLLDYLPMVQNNPSFHDVGVKDTVSPIGWRGHNIENGDKIGDLMRENTQRFVEASKPALLRASLSREIVDAWGANVILEIDLIKVYMQWRSIWAFKMEREENQKNPFRL